MEFWGVEVKTGEPLKVLPGDGMIVHLSQACLGELKKEKSKESVCFSLTVDGQKLVLGTLITDKLPQQQLDLVFEREFELSHNWKNGSVYFYGYKTNNPFDEEDEEISSSEDYDSDEDTPLPVANNGKPETKAKQEKPAKAEKAVAAKAKESNSGKQKVNFVEPSKDDESSDEDTSEDVDEDDSEDEDDSDESDEETPKKAEPSKKRPTESAIQTPKPDKKAKTDGKKSGGHVATPHPAKQAGKTPAADKPNQQTPKSAGSHSCTSCNRTFGSDKALESHSKAKHADGK